MAHGVFGGARAHVVLNWSSSKQNACTALYSAQCRQIEFFEIKQPGWGYVTTVLSVLVL
jgi:hypothetical protein